jgi:PAT family acetyl-CoA transporter-like MFS transporter 1
VFAGIEGATFAYGCIDNNHPDIQSFLAVHLIAKFGFQALESSAYKFMEKGLRKEDFAAIHLLNTPFELLGASIAAKWSRGDRPLQAWQRAFWPRYLIAALVMILFYIFPEGHVGPGYMGAFIAITLLGSFARSVEPYKRRTARSD